MQLTELKEKLHVLIENSDDKKLEAIYTLLQEEDETEKYSMKELEHFYAIRENYLAGKEKTLSVEELIQFVKSKKP